MFEEGKEAPMKVAILVYTENLSVAVAESLAHVIPVIAS